MNVKKILILNTFLFFLLSYLNIFVGQDYISPFTKSKEALFILGNIRLPLYFTVLTVAVVFSVSGLMIQMIFKNNLATPYTLGISSGAVFFIVAASLFFPFEEIFGIDIYFIVSVLSTLIILFFLFKIVSRKNFTFNSVLLVGIAINIFFGSAMMLLQYYSGKSELYTITHWLVGSVEIVEPYKLIPSVLFVVILFFYVFKYSPEIDLMSINTTLALDRGIKVDKIGKTVIVLQALSLGFLIPLTGPLSFIGLIVPNAVRVIFNGFGIRKLLIFSVMFGINFVLAAYFVSLRIKQGEIMPLGVITSVTGALFLIVSLFKSSEV